MMCEKSPGDYTYRRERYEGRAILIVHDNPKRFETLVQELEARGSRVFMEGTLADARRLFRQYKPLDSILIAYRLPDGNGADFCREHWDKTTAPLLLLVPAETLGKKSHLDDARSGATLLLDENLWDEVLLLQMEVFWRRERWAMEEQEARKTSNEGRKQ